MHYSIISLWYLEKDKKSYCIIKLREWKTFNEDGKRYELLGGQIFLLVTII